MFPRYVSLGAALLALTASTASAAPPQINAQGVLKNAEGDLMQGDLTLTFRIYAESEGGEPLWEEAQVVVAADGVFDTLLPADAVASPFPANLFSDGQTRWLAVQPLGQEELARHPLVSVPFALQADSAKTATNALLADEALVAQDVTCVGCITAAHLEEGAIPDAIPAGAIFMFAGECPEGWSPFDALDGRFPRGAVAYGETGGGETHGHSVPAHSHSMSHTHSESSHSHGMGHSHSAPSHSHGMGHKHWIGACGGGGNWDQCDGSPCKDLCSDNGSSGSTGSGGGGNTGGSSSGSTGGGGGGSTGGSSSGSTGSAGSADASTSNHLPPYLDVVYCTKD